MRQQQYQIKLFEVTIQSVEATMSFTENANDGSLDSFQVIL